MSLSDLSNSGTKKNAGKLFQPVKEWGEVPFALAEIVAETQESMPHVAQIADSILDQILGVSSLNLLDLPQEIKEQIQQIMRQSMPPVALRKQGGDWGVRKSGRWLEKGREYYAG